MALEAYRKKRNFDITAEPRGAKGRRTGNLFVVQKHAATRLHYDFRLELDGVLKSWAVTRGPSLVPGEKRLAVHVEDHPLDYGAFEGTIPEGQYGAGAVAVWDRGTWTPEGDAHKGYAKGHLDFTLDGEKLRGRWHLVRMHPRPGEKRENWLLIKADDEEARGANDPDVLEEAPNSVVTNRSIEDIAGDKKSRHWTAGRHAATPRLETPGSPRSRASAPLDGVVKSDPLGKESARARTTKAAFIFKPPKGARKKAQPNFIAPMLPALVAAPPVGATWVHEVKFDGYRIEVIVKNGKVKLRTRTGLDWTDRFPTIAKASASLPSCILDGEIVVESANGISDFSALQNALSEGDTSGVVCYCFDLLYLDGYDLTQLALVARKGILADLLAHVSEEKVLRFSDHFEEKGDLMLQHVCRLGAEGIISKNRESFYLSKRTTDWQKAKCANRQEFVITGFVPSSTLRKAIGSLVLGYYDKGKLRHAGRVGTGFSKSVAREFFADLSRERIAKPPFEKPLSPDARRNVVWIKPDKVAEVDFRGWTADAHVRQASFRGLREDKNPTDIVREQAVAMRKDTDAPKPRVTLTHPDRVLWLQAGVTKQGLADFYAMVWPWIEKHLTGRPLVLLRGPKGISQGTFFQKHPWAGVDARILQIKDPQEREPILGIGSFDGLTALVQSASLEIHPWGAKSDDLDHPDRLIFDLDPGDGVAFTAVITAARDIRERLTACRLKSFVKTTGGKGLHVVVPLKPSATWTVAKDFCHALAEEMARDEPKLYVATSTKAQRPGRIYIDYLRNARGATAVAAYSTRARPEAGVSTPLTWDEVASVQSGSQFTITNFSKRLQHLSADPWDGFFRLRQSLPQK